MRGIHEILADCECMRAGQESRSRRPRHINRPGPNRLLPDGIADQLRRGYQA